jgi:hypothetical protein
MWQGMTNRRSVPCTDRLGAESRAYSAAAFREVQISLTCKQLLTYTGCMVVIPNREPNVPAAISHPARRGMLDLLIEQRNGCELRYRLISARLRPVRDWMAYDGRFWSEHLDQLERRLTKRNE